EVSRLQPQLLERLAGTIDLAQMQEQIDQREPGEERGLHCSRRNRLDAVQDFRSVLQGNPPAPFVLKNHDREIPGSRLQGMLQRLFELTLLEKPLRHPAVLGGDLDAGLLGEARAQEVPKEAMVAVPTRTILGLRDEEAFAC